MTKRSALTLDQIAAINDRAPIEVPISEWGGSVWVRALTLQQVSLCSQRAADPARGGEVHTEKRNGWYLVEGMVDPQITIDVAEVWLTERSAGPVSEILGKILTESGLTERAREAAKSSPESGPSA